MTHNRVSVRWTGPRWLRRFDEYNGRLPFWRAHKIWLADPKTTPEMAAKIGRLGYLEELMVYDIRLSAKDREKLNESVPRVQFISGDSRSFGHWLAVLEK